MHAQTKQGAILAAFFAGYSLTQLVGGMSLPVWTMILIKWAQPTCCFK
jgi:hypothetical protein